MILVFWKSRKFLLLLVPNIRKFFLLLVPNIRKPNIRKFFLLLVPNIRKLEGPKKSDSVTMVYFYSFM